MVASYFSDAELAVLKIDEMIIHLVGPDKAKDYKEYDACNFSRHQAVFLQMFREAAKGQRCKFLAASGVRQTLASDPNGANFVQTSKDIAELFQENHTKNSLAGAFVFARLDVNRRYFWASLKYDKGTGLQYKTVNQNGKLVFEVEGVANPMPTDAKALQKSVLITGTNTGDEVCVNQRGNAAADYLLKWLDVERLYDDAKGTEKLKKALQKTAHAMGDDLDKDDRKRWRGHLHAFATARSMFDTSSTPNFLAQLFPKTTDRALLEKKFNSEANKQKLGGTKFKPDPSVATKPTRRTLDGVNGVRASFTDAAKTANDVSVTRIDGTDDYQVEMIIRNAKDTMDEV